MALETVEVTPAEGKTRRKRAARAKASPRRSASRRRSRNVNLRMPTDQFVRQGKRAINRAYDWAGEAASAMPRFRDLRLPRRSDFGTITEANPLLLGALGLGIGIVLGSLMPNRFSARSMTRLSAGASRAGRRSRR
jgi:hypothetical protein